VIDFDDLIAFDPALARSVTERPDDYVGYASSAATAQMRVEDPEYAEHAGRIFARFRRLPEKRALRKIGAEDMKKLALVEGIVVRTTQVRPMIVKAVFRCRKCLEIVQEEQSGDLMRGPGPTCPICKQKTAWELLEEQCKFKNTQEARVQERPEDLPPGQLPRYLDVRLEDDLVDTARPGDRVAVTSIVRAEKQYVGEKGRLRTFNLYLEANFVDIVGKETEVVEITREDEKKILEISKDPFVHRKLIMSLAPSIYGYGEIKEGILYLLFGGVSKHLPDGVSIRGDLNALLIGDPGCLTGDERVVLGDGTIAKIEDLGDRHLEELKVAVLTGRGGAEKDIATRFHLYRDQPTMEIVTETGKSIRGTHNHPLLSVEVVDRSQVRRWKRLDEFKVGDRVAVVSGFPCYVTGLVNTGWRPLAYGLGPRFRGRLPKRVTSELAAFVGYVLGDGWVQRYRVGFTVADGEKDLLKPLCDMSSNLFGINPTVSLRKGPNRNVELSEGVINSQDVAYNLAILKDKRVPDFILRSGDNVVSSFLRWLYEADGTVFSNKRGCGVIGLKAKDIELLRDVQILLLRFGIHSRIIENALLIRRGRSILRFADKIGFASIKKRTRLAHLKERAARLKRFGRQHSERVVAVYYREPADVYDIEVPKSHQFVANGIVSHNTAKSQLLQ
jgi:replicative DNA helicase Mcm